MMEHELVESSKSGFAICAANLRGPTPLRIVKVSSNEVYAEYSRKNGKTYRQTWTADGSGNERHNFVEDISEVTSP